MQSCSFPSENVILDPPPGIPQGECESVCAFVGYTNSNIPVTVTCWKVSKEEMEAIQKTGRVWLVIMGHKMPPIHLGTVDPTSVNPGDEGDVKST